LNKTLNRIKEFLSYSPSGVASPCGAVFYETSDIPLAKVMELYQKDTTCKSSVDLLAASAVKRFYTTCAAKKDYPDAIKLRRLWMISAKLTALILMVCCMTWLFG
jgi:hypothetical protein